MQIKLYNFLYENNWNIVIHKKDTLTDFKPILHSYTTGKQKKTRGISIVDIDSKIA